MGSDSALRRAEVRPQVLQETTTSWSS